MEQPPFLIYSVTTSSTKPFEIGERIIVHRGGVLAVVSRVSVNGMDNLYHNLFPNGYGFRITKLHEKNHNNQQGFP